MCIRIINCRKSSGSHRYRLEEAHEYLIEERKIRNRIWIIPFG